jgi:hypothetical protein
MYICVCVYMYMCIYVCVYICICVYMYMCIYVYVYICICIYVYILKRVMYVGSYDNAGTYMEKLVDFS